MCKVKVNYNNEEFMNEFYYDETSPSFLRRFNGEIAGSIRKTKLHSWYVKFNGKAYAVHRVIWYIKHGSVSPDKVIDHIDGNSLNNNIKNLREVYQSENNKNHGIQSNNKTGTTGVYYETVSDRFIVTWSEQGVNRSKSFSVKKYGFDEAFSLAKQFRENKLVELTGYSNRHGK